MSPPLPPCLINAFKKRKLLYVMHVDVNIAPFPKLYFVFFFQNDMLFQSLLFVCSVLLSLFIVLLFILFLWFVIWKLFLVRFQFIKELTERKETDNKDKQT